MKKIIIITGPTAVGKTKISIAITKHFQGEIINADASQMRKHLNIGTAKITTAEMDGVKHHLIDFLEPLATFSIKEYQDMGRKLINDIKLPFIVGGSGLYIQALTTDYHLETTKGKSNKYDNYTNEELYQLLLIQDQKNALKLHPNNRRRVIRYLEIIDQQGSLEKIPPKPLYDALTICLTRDRKGLYDNINARCEQMFANGWIDECIQLQNSGIDLEQIKEIGYKEIGQYLKNEITYDELIEIIKQKQRNYAKRQLTWFRNKMDCVFVDVLDNPIEKLINLINNHLGK